MENDVTHKQSRQVYVILNPIAGRSQADDLRGAIERQFADAGWSCEIYATTGAEDLAELTRRARGRGAGLVVAAGGDGTVSGVVNGLVGAEVPLGIIPVGTGNGLARALGIPLEPEAALRLLLGEHLLFALDAMQVGSRYFILNVSAGISSRAMRDTPPQDKRRLGILAYAWTILKDTLQAKTSVFHQKVDGMDLRVRGAEVLVANGTVLHGPPLLFGPRERYHDGQLEVNILTTRQASDYVRLAWDLLLDPQEDKSKLHDLSVQRHILLDALGRSLPVQADGELIGRTPVEIQVVPGALKVVVPALEQGQDQGGSHAN